MIRDPLKFFKEKHFSGLLHQVLNQNKVFLALHGKRGILAIKYTNILCFFFVSELLEAVFRIIPSNLIQRFEI